MFLEYALFINRAPFESLELNFVQRGINILSGINGRGKTTIISHITDAFYEMSRPYFHNTYEGVENKYYRISSYVFQLDASKYSIVYFRFKDNDNNIDYVDCRGNITEEQYENSVHLDDKILFAKISNEIKNNNCAKIFSDNLDKEKVINIFQTNVLTYFPAYRYEQPAYLNDPYKIQIPFKIGPEYGGYLPNPIEVISDLPQLASWILDVVLDWEVYKQTEKQRTTDGRSLNIDVTPELRIFNNLNTILASILSSKGYQGKVRFGIGKRNDSGQRVSIMHDLDNKSEQISPNIFCLSSGESALFCLFGELIRQGDKIHPNISLDKISGIVLIDEIDKHLHIKLQKEILPKLFALFPNIQFIISSHSPFFNIGLTDEPLINAQIIDLDNGGIVTSPTNNTLYEEVYNIMITENEKFAKKYNDLKEQIKHDTKPLIITEGKTDFKHLKIAREHLNFIDVDIEYYDVPDSFGSSELKKMLETLSKVSQPRCIIGIFDRDEEKIISELESDKQVFKRYGESNVFAFAIPLVNEGEYHSKEISIEHYYKQDTLKLEDENKRRLFLGNEFYKSGNSKDGKYQTKLKNIQHKVETNGIIDEKVYERNDLEFKDSIALSKDDFVSLIENNASKIDFSNFSKIFNVIKMILQNH